MENIALVFNFREYLGATICYNIGQITFVVVSHYELPTLFSYTLASALRMPVLLDASLQSVV